MAFKPHQPSIVPDSYLVLVRRPKPKKDDGLSAEFPSAGDMAEATRHMAREIRKLARAKGETILLETCNLEKLGVLRLKCDRHFAELVKQLPGVGHVEQEHSVYPPNKTPRFNK